MSNGVNKPSGEAIDPRLVRKLADILRDTELTEIEVEQGGLKIRVARALSVAPAPVHFAAAPQATAAPAVPATPPQVAAPAAAEPVAAAVQARGEQVKSPMVGTVYLQPSPGSDPFVTPGAKVKAGQTLLIIEAMKTMNPIPAPRDGTLVEVLVGDGQPVEFGEPLAVIE
jgi:acetyl-CoA carboxylase biotin carboxyl carrier protein